MEMSSPDGMFFGQPPKANRLKRIVVAVVFAIIGVMMVVIIYGIYGRSTAAASQELARTYTPASATAQEVMARNKKSAVPTTQPPVYQGAQPPSAAVPHPVMQHPPPQQYAASMSPLQVQHEVTPEEKAQAAAIASEQQALVAPASPSGWKVPGSSPGEPAAPHSATQQDDKEAFLERKAPKPDLLAVRVAPKSPYVILSGWLIPATLQTMMSSDLPGGITARVRSNVFDTATGRYLLIPQGSMLVGVYSSHVSYGQRAAQQVWDRMNFPDGSSMDLGSMEGHDAQGRSGLRDKVDNHYKRIFATAFLTSGFFALGALSQSRRGSVLAYPSAAETAGSSMAQQMSEQGIEITRQNTRIQPTIEIRPGDKFDVFVNRDMVFQAPYRPMVAK